jgi:hypothetical protein
MQSRVELDRELRLKAKSFRAKAVQLLDAVLRVEAIATHVPFAHRTVGTGNWIRVTDDAYDQIARRETAVTGCFQHPSD